MARRPEGDCPLCGGSDRRRLVTKAGFDVVRCAACRLVYVWPRPGPEELEARYSAGGYHAAVDEAERRRTFARRLRQIEELVPRRGRLLDVGCSKGLFLDVARAEGWDVAGVDLNRNAVAEARARGLDVRHGELAPGLFEPESFDAVTLFDLLEHTGDPLSVLGACRALLRPGGLLAVTTPDVGGLVPRVTYGLFGRTLGAWDHPTPPGHLVQFSRRTLGRALEKAGFETVAERSEHIPVAYSAGKLENSILDVLAGRHRTRPEPPRGEGDRCSVFGVQGSGTSGSRLVARSTRLLARGLVRALSWAVVGLAGLAARATGWGDSIFVAARRED